MTFRMTSNGLVWQAPWELFFAQIKLLQVCEKWEGTPYMSGQCMPGVGVDCVRWICAVLDEMHGVRSEVPPTIRDRAMHDREGALALVETVRGFYPGSKQLDPQDRQVEPGDVLLTGHPRGGPGHAILVGPLPNTLWQATAGGVHWGGLGLLHTYQHLHAILRPDKSSWNILRSAPGT